jgi:hypothetical protein
MSPPLIDGYALQVVVHKCKLGIKYGWNVYMQAHMFVKETPPPSSRASRFSDN